MAPELVSTAYFINPFCLSVRMYIYLPIVASQRYGKSKSHYDRQPVGQSVLVSGAHLGPATNFTFALKISSDSCEFVIL
jgi:hypothetical protein